MIKNLKNHPKYAQMAQWTKLISVTGSAQIILQAVGFLSGILVIRLLPMQEYALYTLANTMLGTMTILADGGISTGVLAQGGKVWQDKEKLGAVLNTGLHLRKKFALVSLLVSTPILLYILLHNGASWVMAGMIVLSLIPAFYAALSDALLQVGPKLHQSILPLQKNQVGVAIGRLLLTTATLFVFPWAFVAVLAAGIPRIFGNIKLKKITQNFVDTTQLPDPKVQKDIIALVKRIMPTSIYYCVSGQITIWLISIFGSTVSVAELGALSRLTTVMSIISVLITTLIVPRFAKLALDKKLLFKRFSQIMGSILVLLFLIIILVYFFSEHLLWILGNDYQGLKSELLLSVVGSCIALLSGISYSLTSARGWVLSPIVLISINLFTIVFFASILDLSSLNGALLLNIGINTIALLQLSLFCMIRIIKI